METERVLDLTGLKCPMPIVRLNMQIKELQPGDELTAFADDPAFCLDVESWCQKTGHVLVCLDKTSERMVSVIRKNGSINKSIS